MDPDLSTFTCCAYSKESSTPRPDANQRQESSDDPRRRAQASRARTRGRITRRGGRRRPHRSDSRGGAGGTLRGAPDRAVSEGRVTEAPAGVALVVLDASVVIALLDAGDAHHAAA